MEEKRNNTKRSSRRRQLRFGGYALLSTVLFIAVVILVNLGVQAMEDRWALRVDLSYNSLTKLSDQTKNALGALDEDIVYYVMAAPGAEDMRMLEVLDRYRVQSEHVRYEVIDPERSPGLVNRLRAADPNAATLGSNSVIVTNAAETRVKVYPYTELVDIVQDSATQQYVIRSYAFERMFTQGLLYVTAEKTPTIYLLQGHGEIPQAYLADMEALLTANNYDVLPISLGDALPASNTDLLMLLSPMKDLTEAEYTQIAAFLENGGNLLYACDVTAENGLPYFNALLAPYGAGFEEGMVVADMYDTTQYYPLQPTYLLPKLGEHAITTPLTEAGQAIVLMPQTRAIALPAMDRSDFVVTPLLMSAEGSYRIDVSDTARTSIERQPEDVEGPFTLAAAVQRMNFTDPDKESRVVLLGGSMMITTEQLLNAYNNGEFLLSAVKWATKDEAIDLSIVSKTAQRTGLQLHSARHYYTLGVLVVLVMPLLVLIIGVVVWQRRRHL